MTPAGDEGERPAARFDLAIPSDVRFGAGRIDELASTLVGLGVTHVLLVTGRDPSRAASVRSSLSELGVENSVLAAEGEPSVDNVRDGVTVARRSGCDGVVGFGGGSALDLAKAVAVLTPTGADPLDHMEVIGHGRPLTSVGLPCVAVPTTAGTGSEVTRNSSLSSGGRKASLRSPHMLPRVALVDPDLLAGLTAETIASSGSDALAQLIEPFLSARANPVTDALAREGMRRSARSLKEAYERGLAGDAVDLREDLAMASLLGGLSLANSGLGAAHGIASVVGGRYEAPHGAVCAALIAPTVAVNTRALQQREPRHLSLAKVSEVARLLTGDPASAATDAVDWLRALRSTLHIPGLSRYGATSGDVAELVEQARDASSTRANPIVLTDAELAEIITAAL